ncbi:MAG: hypothetical protein H6793_03020 [Candidatus Nomurabacteria bacterium]|nr:hypothetical protein [Candidatus Saccharibacteria bacterium]USN95279.1 MAG: hypothetical protein H6793_03020 [Candidatus Nomurabacteria bacterium]
MKNKKINKSKPKSQKNFKILKKTNLKSRKIQFGVIAVLIALVGAGYLVFAKAHTLNCQKQDNVDICDVNQTAGGTDTILSVGPEAETLGNSGWGWYLGASFRAPSSAYNGAVPVHRVVNTQYGWHEWVTDAQKRDKEAKYGALQYEGVAFYAWENKVSGTVPVYRLTAGGSGTKSFFTTDKAQADKFVADGANDPNGWKMDGTMPSIAFYAYPPGYSVPNQTNPGDCSKPENFTKDICKKAAENLEQAIKEDVIPATKDCPKDIETYRKAPFPGQFSEECQKKWNDALKARASSSTTTPSVGGGSSSVGSGSSATTTPGAPGAVAPIVTIAGQVAPTVTGDKPIDPCPESPNMDDGLTAYINGVNKEKKNYSMDCHKKYMTFAQNKNISPCPTADSLDKGLMFYLNGVNNEKKNYDINCHTWYLTYARNKSRAEQIAKYSDADLDRECAKSNKPKELQDRCNDLFYRKVVMNNAVAEMVKKQEREREGANALLQAGRYTDEKQFVEIGFCGIMAYNDFQNPHDGGYPYVWVTPDHKEYYLTKSDCIKQAQAIRAEFKEYHKMNNTNSIKSMWDPEKYETLKRYQDKNIYGGVFSKEDIRDYFHNLIRR